MLTFDYDTAANDYDYDCDYDYDTAANDYDYDCAYDYDTAANDGKEAHC